MVDEVLRSVHFVVNVSVDFVQRDHEPSPDVLRGKRVPVADGEDGHGQTSTWPPERSG